ncbi:glycerol kinase GlpK [Caldicellulosiruptoraceae bacterium PP1]
MGKYILSLDQGTSSSRAVVFSEFGEIISFSQKEIKQVYPEKGWVEQDPYEILNTQIEVAKEAINKANINISELKAIGITNQRETTIVWDKTNGKPVYNAIVWQCRRTKDYCNFLKEQGMEEIIHNKTGLLIDPYFSATKIKWILENVCNNKYNINNLAFGTVDSWLIYNLTGGKVHATDVTNASRTMLLNIETIEWDKELLEYFNIPETILPKIKDSNELFGITKKETFGAEIPIYAVLGDQQSALFGQCCFEKGMVKNTYGTGCFALLNTGQKPYISKNGLLSTIAWRIDNKTTYALEGSVFIAGYVIKWLRDNMKLLQRASESETIANDLKDNGGVYFVPAFVGLGAPYWDSQATGTIIGITSDTTKEHIIRSALESIAFQTFDVISTFINDTNIDIKEIRVDGGACQNNFLMQFQSNILKVPIIRPRIFETTALGVFFMAGLSVGIFNNFSDIKKIWQKDKEFIPNLDENIRLKYIEKWRNAIVRSRGWTF